MSAQLSGRRVLVTGASSGIGEAVLRACAAAGAHTAGVARREDRLAGIAEETGAAAVPADLTDEAAARRAVDLAADALGGLDALVNNAGLMRSAPVSEGRVEDWRAMFELNVLALLVVTSAALPHLRAAERADIVNMSSQSGRRVAAPAGGVYSATKFAVHALSDGLRQELGPEGMRVTVVAPGLVRTGLLDDAPPGPATERLLTRQRDLGIDPAAVAAQVVHALAQPPSVHLREIVVAPTAQPN